MPYIKPEDRTYYQPVLDEMTRLGVNADGALNYILYAYCVRHVHKNYGSLKNYCSELRQCATEIERRILAPYEDTKIEENGDVT